MTRNEISASACVIYVDGLEMDAESQLLPSSGAVIWDEYAMKLLMSLSSAEISGEHISTTNLLDSFQIFSLAVPLPRAVLEQITT